MESKKIIEQVKSDEKLKSSERLGFCREWTKTVILFVRRKFPSVKVEAREVDITPNLQHTFVRLTEKGQEPILCDGVGTVYHPPYFGPENEAPEHLQNSKSDMINKYI